MLCIGNLGGGSPFARIPVVSTVSSAETAIESPRKESKIEEFATAADVDRKISGSRPLRCRRQ
jgi:hypothetical protein